MFPSLQPFGIITQTALHCTAVFIKAHTCVRFVASLLPWSCVVFCAWSCVYVFTLIINTENKVCLHPESAVNPQLRPPSWWALPLLSGLYEGGGPGCTLPPSLCSPLVGRGQRLYQLAPYWKAADKHQPLFLCSHVHISSSDGVSPALNE